MTSVAAKVVKEKELHPERFCPVKRCLWKTGGGYCPRHTDRVVYHYPGGIMVCKKP